MHIVLAREIRDKPMRKVLFIRLSLISGCGSDPQSLPESIDWTITNFSQCGVVHDVASHRLCVDSAQPDLAPDPVYIDCMVETWVNPNVSGDGRERPVVLTYNIERGHYVDEQIELLLLMQGPRLDTF